MYICVAVEEPDEDDECIKDKRGCDVDEAVAMVTGSVLEDEVEEPKIPEQRCPAMLLTGRKPQLIER